VQSETWKPDTAVTVTFNSDPIELGTLTADAGGAVQGTFAVPTSVAPGAHTVALTGTGESDEPQTLSIAFTVVAPATPGSTTATGAPVATVAGTTTAAGPLAFTGAGTRDLASVGVLLLAVGLLAMDLSWRRRTSKA
jgi:hexosaminidase